MKPPTRLLIALSILVTLTAAVFRASSIARAQEPKAPSELLEGLLKETGWRYVQEHDGIFRVPMEEGPDVWVHASGDYVCTRAIVGDLPPPEELTTKLLLDLLMANFSMYRGKFGVDEGRTVWLEVNTPRRLFDGRELGLNILFVARAAAEHRITPKKTVP